MSRSYQSINYNLRPAKSVERKMLCEALRKLIFLSDLTKYKYVGFGSTFFTDFLLIHKSLGINNLISIEKEKRDEDRIKFNRPYGCIKLHFGEANSVLPIISWAKKMILWLDYDERLQDNMLTDIGTFISRAQAGSVVFLTINVKPDKLGDDRLNLLTKRIDKAKIPIDVAEKDLDQHNYPRVCYNIVNNEIDEVLGKRNGGLEDKLIYKQILNFYYKDSVPMLSIGGILYAEKDGAQVEKCDFEGLNFARCKRDIYDPYTISIPNFTFREMRSIDKLMPNKNILKVIKEEGLAFLDEEKIKSYSDIYRYMPNFVEAEIH